jgi:hypothetical protein
MKSGFFGLPWTLAVDRVEETVLRELGMEIEADESALQPVVDGVGKCLGRVGEPTAC